MNCHILVTTGGAVASVVSKCADRTCADAHLLCPRAGFIFASHPWNTAGLIHPPYAGAYGSISARGGTYLLAASPWLNEGSSLRRGAFALLLPLTLAGYNNPTLLWRTSGFEVSRKASGNPGLSFYISLGSFRLLFVVY
jgi:hypothetical protein